MRGGLVAPKAFLLVAVGFSTMLTVGCGSHVHEIEIKAELASNNAADRREALIELAKSDERSEAWAFEILQDIALRETDTQTRCIAICALGTIRKTKSSDILAAILSLKGIEDGSVVEPNSNARIEAVTAIGVLGKNHWLFRVNRGKAIGAVATILGGDLDRNVRIAAADALGNIRDAIALVALIAGLKDDDFGVVHACQQSLVRISRDDFGYDVNKWQTWYDANEERFLGSVERYQK